MKKLLDCKEKIKVLPLTPTHTQHRIHVKYFRVSQNDRCYYTHPRERFLGNSDLPFSSHFGDLQAKVHRVEIGGFPLEDVVTPAGLVSLLEETNPL